jgi:hypothetical protein
MHATANLNHDHPVPPGRHGSVIHSCFHNFRLSFSPSYQLFVYLHLPTLFSFTLSCAFHMLSMHPVLTETHSEEQPHHTCPAQLSRATTPMTEQNGSSSSHQKKVKRDRYFTRTRTARHYLENKSGTMAPRCSLSKLWRQ